MNDSTEKGMREGYIYSRLKRCKVRRTREAHEQTRGRLAEGTKEIIGDRHRLEDRRDSRKEMVDCRACS